jgi:hypothetical protein
LNPGGQRQLSPEDDELPKLVVQVMAAAQGARGSKARRRRGVGR